VTDVAALLQDFYRDKLGMLLSHQAAARLVAQYDANNTYQYIINREEVQLSWLAAAIAELGGTLPPPADEHRRPPDGGTSAAAHLIEEDRRGAQTFVDRWRPRIEAMTNARHAKMLSLILGETLEQKRFFDQALAGRTDLLGRRAGQLEPARGEVLPSRWIE
jgi:hypothetical protein